MPANYTYPGVYVEEMPSEVRTIAGVSTSDTAFVGFFERGPVDQATRITSFGDFQRVFGGLDVRSETSYAIQQYYLNGGSIAWVVRVAANAKTAMTTLKGDAYSAQAILEVRAASPGIWGNNVEVAVDHNVASTLAGVAFNLVAREVVEVDGKRQILSTETFRNLNMNKQSAQYAVSVVNGASGLIHLTDVSAGGLPADTGTDVINDPQTGDFRVLGRSYGDLAPGEFESGHDGTEPGSDAWINDDGADALLGGDTGSTDKTGIFALEKIAPNIFNILCLPEAAEMSAASLFTVYSEAAKFCRDKRAFLIVDIPEDKTTVKAMMDWLSASSNSLDALRDDHAAVYFPRLLIADRLNGNRPRNVAASGTLAGVYARTDSTRGIWKAPAGTDATLRGANLAVKITDNENGGLNPFGINALRSFPIFGNVSWGARTLDGADQKASQYKYIPIRRLALYIEESLYQGLKWVVFEPNDAPLWAQIRLNVGAFMHNLFRQGAFQGTSPREAYFVKCDSETTPQNDIDLGIVNIVVGFAPLKPAEFVVIKIQQIAGQLEA